MKSRVVLLGPPGSGKGTVAEKLEVNFDLKHISSGHWFRQEMNAGTKLGEEVREYVIAGQLVPDSLVLGLFEHWLKPELISGGFLLDGFPRTLAQAEALDRDRAEHHAPLETVLFLDCPEDVILDRITGRRVCLTCGKTWHVRSFPPRSSGICDQCGSPLRQRPDDQEEVVKNRLEFYRQITEPLVAYYRECGKLVSLNAALGSEAAYAHAAQTLAS